MESFQNIKEKQFQIELKKTTTMAECFQNLLKTQDIPQCWNVSKIY